MFPGVGSYRGERGRPPKQIPKEKPRAQPKAPGCAGGVLSDAAFGLMIPKFSPGLNMDELTTEMALFSNYCRDT